MRTRNYTISLRSFLANDHLEFSSFALEFHALLGYLEPVLVHQMKSLLHLELGGDEVVYSTVGLLFVEIL
jgi:hypothetical protein